MSDQLDLLKNVDPVTFEIIENALSSAADEMALVIMRSAYSTIVRDSMDFSTAICDARGRTIAQSLTNPIHLGSFPDVLGALLKRYGGSIDDGDIFIVNEPYGFGGMHLPDITILKPIFAENCLCGFAAALVHHSDVGGLIAGSMALHATEIFQEGIRIPLIRLGTKGRVTPEIIELLAQNSRAPKEFNGDIRAQLAACEAGAKGIIQLIERYGGSEFERYVEVLHAYSERLTRQRIRALTPGTYEAYDTIEGFGKEPIKLAVKITVSDEEVDIDWAGSSEQVPFAINGPVAITRSMSYVALRAVLGQGIPNCGGITVPIMVRAPLGSIVNPTPPAACAARGILAYRMLDTLFSALAQVCPERVPATGEGGPSVVSMSGVIASKHWVLTDGVLGSWGGRATKDGIEGLSNPGCNLTNQPIEVLESRFPLLIEAYGFVPNSGGAGRHRGGLAIARSYRVLQDETVLTIRSDRRVNCPAGFQGGLDGTPSVSVIDRGQGPEEIPVNTLVPIVLSAGAYFLHVTAGAAGLGHPAERTYDKVLDDVVDGKLDSSYAEAVYRVVISDGIVDHDKTAALRSDSATTLPKDSHIAEFERANPIIAASRQDGKA